MTPHYASRNVVVTHSQGLHARPADLIAKLSSRFQSTVELVKGHERVDGKSILTIMTLAAAAGTRLSIEAAGPDAQQAVDAVADLIENNFAEENNLDRG